MTIVTFQGKKPVIAKDAYISERASVIGAVTIGARSSVWEHATIRADYNTIIIGSESSIQDNCTVHCDLRFPTRIGDGVTLGHNSVAHGCTIEDNVLIGIGAAILNNAYIGDHCIVGAGCVVTPGTKIPANSLVLGVPGKVVRSLTKADMHTLEDSRQAYVLLSRKYLAEAK